MKFQWDENKAEKKQLKHRVTFEEAQTVFEDPLYVDFYDPDHSEDEERYLIIGISIQRRLLIVSYTERENSTRLISARETTRSEQEAYEEG
jgi:uncharacterized protein